MVPLPNTLSSYVDKLGRMAQPWISYLQQFTQSPPNVMSVNVTSSPFSYTAREPGTLAITSGTVSSTILTRGSINIDITGTKLIPVGINDTVTVTYEGLPTIQFIPAYGQNTNG